MEFKNAYKLYNEMKLNGYIPDNITYTTVLNACTNSMLFENNNVIFDDIDKQQAILNNPQNQN